LLLFCFIIYSESPAEGNNHISVTGKTGEHVTLSCESEDRDISLVEFNKRSRNIFACENEECKSADERVFKEGSCDIIIEDLIFSDAGKYTLIVYYSDDQEELEPQIREYHLHIHDEISVQEGEDLELDVVLTIAGKVEHQNRRSSGWTELWRKDRRTDPLTVKDMTLIINDFTVTDTGTYRVLDYEGETLITVSVSVTESGTDSEETLDTDDDKTDEQHSKTGGIERFTQSLSSEFNKIKIKTFKKKNCSLPSFLLHSKK
ncbi:hypothetical protein PO909_003897, partial [Leuciscus waleckii]